MTAACSDRRSANNLEDDVAIISGKTALISDHGSSAATATDVGSFIGGTSATAVKVAGVVSQSGAYDFFRFTASESDNTGSLR